jgi:hypothetical protein
MFKSTMSEGPLHLVAILTPKPGKLDEVCQGIPRKLSMINQNSPSFSPSFFTLCFVEETANMSDQLLAEIHKITQIVEDREHGILRFFAFEAERGDGVKQIVFVEKYLFSILHA